MKNTRLSQLSKQQKSITVVPDASTRATKSYILGSVDFCNFQILIIIPIKAHKTPVGPVVDTGKVEDTIVIYD